MSGTRLETKALQEAKLAAQALEAPEEEVEEEEEEGGARLGEG